MAGSQGGRHCPRSKGRTRTGRGSSDHPAVIKSGSNQFNSAVQDFPYRHTLMNYDSQIAEKGDAAFCPYGRPCFAGTRLVSSTLARILMSALQSCRLHSRNA